MNKKIPFPVILVCFCLAMASLSLIDCSASAQQEASIAALTPTLALGRTFVREAGLRSHTRDDGPAIHAVISFRATHIYQTDYLSAVLRATNNAPIRSDAPRPWITQLMPNMARPPLYPGHLRWEGRGGRNWRLTFQQARETRRGEIEHQCRVPGATEGEDEYVTPHDWGNFYDAARYRRNNPTAVDLDCGQTCTLLPDGNVALDRQGNPKCNYFLHLPRYETRFGEI
ncbi:hypothetical protein LCGC14_0884030 [marine sediment metagenome]|uniref:Uncharacterized protein n=1 Tax=marine sediment metagenome TaxID=412755 RepID=A0A0F9P134_9ZZZZ